MSKRDNSDEMQLPDDAEQRINEMLDALGEGEASVGRGTSADEGWPADDAQSDFVDLDAELLDNSADVLELDEEDSLEERLLEEMKAGAQSFHEEVAPAEAPPIPRAHQRFDSESMAARFRELEQELMRRQAASLRVPPPATRARDTLPAWLTPLLVLIALVMSGGALWLTLNGPLPPTTPSVELTGGGLAGMKAELGALRERLAAVEQQAEEGKEAVAILERMQQIVDRMEQKLLSRGDATEGVVAASGEAAVPGETTAEPDSASDVATVGAATIPEEEAPKEAAAPGTKTFIKGWAVNLGSYYYKADAARVLKRYLKAGIAAEIREIPKGSATWYRIRVKGFESKQAAQAFIDGLTIEQGREEAWPSYYEGYVEG